MTPAPEQRPTFQDTRGRVWEVALTPRSLAAIRDAGTDLDGVLGTGDGFAAFAGASAVGARVGMLWAAVRATAAADGVTFDAFREALDGRAVADGVSAVLWSAAEFYPNSPFAAMLRTDFKGIAAKLGELVRAQMEHLAPHVADVLAAGTKLAGLRT